MTRTVTAGLLWRWTPAAWTQTGRGRTTRRFDGPCVPAHPAYSRIAAAAGSSGWGRAKRTKAQK